MVYGSLPFDNEEAVLPSDVLLEHDVGAGVDPQVVQGLVFDCNPVAGRARGLYVDGIGPLEIHQGECHPLAQRTRLH